MGNKGGGGSGSGIPVPSNTPGEAKLRVYIMTENVSSLERLLTDTPSLLTKRFSAASPASGLTPLELAASQGLKAATSALLALGSPPTARNFRNETPLFFSIKSRDPGVVSLLLAHHSKDELNARSSKGETPLILAIKSNCTQIVEMLLCRGADVGIPDSSRRFPLHHAVSHKHIDIAVMLLSNDASLNELDDDGDSPLTTAAFHGTVNTVSLLVNKGANKTVVNRYGRSMFSAACQGAPGSLRPIHWAVMGCTVPSRKQFGPSWDVVAALLHARIADLYDLDDQGRSLLHTAVVASNPVCAASMSSSNHVLNRLLALGLDPNHVDNWGYTALHYAITGGVFSAEVDAEGGNNRSRSGIRCALALSLLARGADPLLRASDGKSAMDYAIESVASGRSAKSDMEKTLYRTLDYLTHRNMTYSLRSVLGPSEGSVVHVSQPSVTPALLPPDATPADGDDSEDVSLSDGDVQVDIPHGLVVPPVPPDPFPDGFLADVPASADSSTCAVMPSTTPTPPPPPPPISAQHWEESDSVRRVLSEASRVRRGHSTTPRSDPFDDV